MENLFAVSIILLVLYNVYGCKSQQIKKVKKIKSTKQIKKNKSKQIKAKTNDLEQKQKYIEQTIQAINSSIPETKKMDLISAYTVDPEENYNCQFKSTSKKLETINSNEIKGRDFIKTNFTEPDPVKVPAPAPALTPSNEIIGITNAPMYAPVDLVDKSVDIFLINQINTTKNNSLAYLDQPIVTLNNKANYIKNIIVQHSNPSKNVENVQGWDCIKHTHAEI
jgi:hypothetical protein